MKNNELEKFLDLNTDHYFKKTKHIILKNKDMQVTYAVFMRRPVLFCPSLAIKWLRKIEKISSFKNGSWWIQDFSSFFPIESIDFLEKNKKYLADCK